MASASVKRRRTPKKRSAKAEVEEQILEKGWCPGLKEQQQSEQEHHSQVENEMARVRMQQLLSGGTAAITPDHHGAFPG